MAKSAKKPSYNFDKLENIQDFFIMDFQPLSENVIASGSIFYLGKTYKFLTSHADFDCYVYVVFEKEGDTVPVFYFILYHNPETGRFELTEKPKKKQLEVRT